MVEQPLDRVGLVACRLDLAGRTDIGDQRASPGLLVAQAEVKGRLANARLRLDIGGVDIFLDPLVVVEVALQIADRIGTKYSGCAL